MSTTQMIVLALPHGRDPDNADLGLISVCLLPRLTADGMLADYPDWRQWPLVATEIEPTPVINGVRAVPAELEVRSTPSPAVWAAVFPDPTKVTVEAFAFDGPVAVGEQLRSYPQAAVGERLLEIYTRLAADSPTEPPTLGQARAAFGDDLGLQIDALRTYLGGPTGPAIDDDSDPLEFHTVLSVLRRHPHLCRLLGLTIELAVDLRAMGARGLPPAGPGRTFLVQTGITWQQAAAGREASFPAVPADGAFRPVNDEAGTLDGQLALGEQSIFQFGVGHTLSASLELARRIADADDDDPLPNPLTQAAPLELRRRDRAGFEAVRLQRQAVVDTEIMARMTTGDIPLAGDEQPGGGPMELRGGDVLSTYRADVLGGPHDATTLRSLHERAVPDGYAFDKGADVAVLPPDDEGWVSLVMTTESGQDIAKVPESLLVWDGWSLSALRPVNRLDAAGDVAPATPTVPQPGDSVTFGVDYTAVPGSLPRLAYGHEYRVRCRLVDLAGNSIPNTDEGAIVSPPVFYGRTTPLPAPLPVRRSPSPDVATPGDTTREVVITSLPGQDDTDVTPEDRLLFPAPSATQEWELMDRPADLFTAGGYTRLSSLDARTLDDQLVSDPTTGDRFAGRIARDGSVAAGAMTQTADYLRDPAVRGVRLTNLPGQADGDAVLLDHRSASTDPADIRLRTARLMLHAGIRRPRVKGSGNREAVHVWIPKAYVGQITLASTMDPGLANRFALREPLGGDVSGYVDGQHWLASARSTMTLIHAIPLPRVAPTFQTLGVERALNQSGALLQGVMGTDVPATSTLTLVGSWEEVIDDPATPGPERADRRAVLGTQDIEYVFDAEEAEVALTPSFTSTARRLVTVRGEAVSRFSRYFIRPTAVSFDTGDVQAVSSSGLVDATFTLQTADRAQTLVRGQDYEVDAVAGTVRRLPGSTIPADTPLTALFAPGPGRRRTTEGDTPTVELLVPSSAPPPAPEIIEAVPARSRLSWGGRKRRHVQTRGQIIRLRLARPWFASGDGERLAVLVDRASGDVPATSRMGRDPRTYLEDGVERLAVGSFPAADLLVEDVTATLPDGRQVQVDAVGHTPTYDADRQEWVVDVQVDTAAYRPFIRLTVARLQPDAIAPQTDPDTALTVDCRLSQAVDVASLRLGAEREVRVEARGRRGRTHVRVLGNDHDGIPGADGLFRPNLVQATAQQADAGIDDPHLRWTSIAEPTQLVLNRGDTESTWEGELQVPTDGGAIRLLVEELEPVVVDDGSDGGIDSSDLSWVEVLDVPRLG